MKKNITLHTAKKGALILAATMILGGCGGTKEPETTASEETTVEEATEETSEEATEEKESAESEEESTGNGESKEEESSESAESNESEAESGDSKEAAKEEGGVTPKSVYEAIEKEVELPAMIEGDDDFISNYYGINPADLDGYVFASAEDATLADSIIIMNAKSEEAVDHIVSALNTVIEQKSAEMENYLPEQYEIVAKSSVKTKGSCVYLVISNDADSIEAVIQAAIK